MEARYGAVFLDVGETLVYAHPSAAEIMAAVCAEQGFPVEVARMEAADAAVVPRMLSSQPEGELYSISPENSQRFWTSVYREVFRELAAPAELVPRLSQACHERFMALETWRLFPDSLPALQAIQRLRETRGLVVGVISNWEDWLEALLVQLEIDHYFDFAVVSSGVRLEKPDPRIFRAALEQAGVAPERALHVGDSLHADVGGARAVGIAPVLIDRRGRYTPEQVGDATVIRSLEELLPLLG